MYLNYLVILTLIIIDNFDNVYIIWGCNTLCPGDRRLILKKRARQQTPFTSSLRGNAQ